MVVHENLRFCSFYKVAGHFFVISVQNRSIKPRTDQPTRVRLDPTSDPPGVTDVFVWLTETPAPSYFRFSALYKCSYLLT